MTSVKVLRKELGLTVKELAEYLKVAERTVFRWESGYTEPRASQLQAIEALKTQKKEVV